MKQKIKVIVAHPGKQHSFQTAYALKKNGYLFKYVTTVYDKKGSLTHCLKNALKGDLKKKANSRKSSLLNDQEVIQFDELKGIILIFISKIFGFNGLWKKFNLYISNSFGKKVAKYAIKNKVDIVICYDSNCTKMFKYLSKKAPNIIKIMDVSIATRQYMKTIYEKDIIISNNKSLRIEQSNLWNDKLMKYFNDEINYTDYFFVASDFVKKSLNYCNVKDDKIFQIPYGVDVNKFKFRAKKNYNLPLKLVFVGNVIYRKGIHHLLNVVSSYSKKDITLNIVGQFDTKSEIYQKYKDFSNINFCGFVTHDEIIKIYNKSDIFVFPSLAEGFALVSLEALSCGLPVIISTNSGGNDAVINYKNGIIIDPLNENELRKSIDWFLTNLDQISLMSIVAHKSAQKYSWDNYYSNITNAINFIISERINI